MFMLTGAGSAGMESAGTGSAGTGSVGSACMLGESFPVKVKSLKICRQSYYPTTRQHQMIITLIWRQKFSSKELFELFLN